MSVPTSELVWAGTWNSTTLYPQLHVVQSPIDLKAYVQVNINSITGGADPSVQPSIYWVEIPVLAPVSGITSINGLVAPAMSMVSTDASVSINPLAPDKVDFTVGGTFPPAYGSFSSTQPQPINPLFPAIAPLPLVYDTKDCTAVGLNVLFPSADIQVLNKGLYKILSSVQLNRKMGGNSEVDMYVTINGNALPNSATKLNLNMTEESVMTVEWFADLNANDLINIVLYSTDAGNEALAVPSNPPVPAIPSIITTILRIA